MAKWMCFRFMAVKGTIMVDQIDTELFSRKLRRLLLFQTNALLILVGCFTYMANGGHLTGYPNTCLIFLDKAAGFEGVVADIFLGGYTIIELITSVLLLRLFLKPLLSNNSDLISQRLMKVGKFNLYVGSVVIAITTISMILITIFSITARKYGLFFSTFTELDITSNCIYHLLSLRYVWERHGVIPQEGMNSEDTQRQHKLKNMILTSTSTRKEEANLSKTLLSETL
jgi:hypothetical protein